MSNHQELGAKPKKDGARKWSFISTNGNKKKEPSNQIQNEKQSGNEYTDSIKKEVKRLEDINKRYEEDYIQERKIMLFNLFEKQYLLTTKSNYYNQQSNLIAAIRNEQRNIETVFQTYQERLDSNASQLHSINEGAASMEKYFTTIKQEIKKLSEEIDMLDNNRREAANSNANLRIKYLNLLQHESRAHSVDGVIYSEDNAPLHDIINEIHTCLICYNLMTDVIFPCRYSHYVCSTCRKRIQNNCPFCGAQDGLHRNRLAENLLRATKNAPNTKQRTLQLD